MLWTEEPGRLQSIRSQSVGHNSVTSLSLSFQMYREMVKGLACYANECKLYWAHSGKLPKASKARRRATFIWPVASALPGSFSLSHSVPNGFVTLLIILSLEERKERKRSLIRHQLKSEIRQQSFPSAVFLWAC